MKRDLLFRAFRSYMRFVHDSLYYRNVDIIGRENVPEYGTPTLVVANHQSALSDPIGLHFAFHKEKVTIFARGDIFNNPKLGRFFRWIGLLPAYRLRVDGEENLDRNYGAFEEAGDRLLDGGIVAIFPEAVNQDKHWLGEWSQGYLRMAFETAERDGFKTDIKVLPAAVHYSHYFSARKDLVIKFGEPMSLMPYYERYKSKPRTVWREVNAEMRRRVGEMMLNITDLENYDAIDYIRETYGVRYARKRGANPRSLPERLITDKELCRVLEENSDVLKDELVEDEIKIILSIAQRYDKLDVDLVRQRLMLEKIGLHDYESHSEVARSVAEEHRELMFKALSMVVISDFKVTQNELVLLGNLSDIWGFGETGNDIFNEVVEKFTSSFPNRELIIEED